MSLYLGVAYKLQIHRTKARLGLTLSKIHQKHLDHPFLWDMAHKNKVKVFRSNCIILSLVWNFCTYTALKLTYFASWKKKVYNVCTYVVYFWEIAAPWIKSHLINRFKSRFSLNRSQIKIIEFRKITFWKRKVIPTKVIYYPGRPGIWDSHTTWFKLSGEL